MNARTQTHTNSNTTTGYQGIAPDVENWDDDDENYDWGFDEEEFIDLFAHQQRFDIINTKLYYTLQHYAIPFSEFYEEFAEVVWQVIRHDTMLTEVEYTEEDIRVLELLRTEF
jgi:hypothetical protein